MKRAAIGGGAAILLLLGGGGAYLLYRAHQGRDIRGNPTVEFTPSEPKQAVEPPQLVWPLYGYDPARLRAPRAFKLHPPFRAHPVWTFRARSLLEFPPVIGYDKIFIVNNRGVVFALHERTGRVAWKYRSDRCAAVTPGLGRHLVFVTLLNRLPCNQGGSHLDGRLIAFRAATGQIAWQREIGPSESSPLVAGDAVIVGDWRNTVYSFTATTGRLRWSYTTGGKIKAGPSLSGGRVFVGSYDEHVYALNARTGKKLWSVKAQPRIGRTGTFYASPAAAYGRVYVGATDGKVYSYGARSGKLRWSQSTGDFVYTSPAVWNRLVFVGSYDGTFYALDAATGDTRWRFDAGGKVSGSPTVIDGVVYFSTFKGRTYGLDARTGRVRWRYPDGQYANVVASKRRLYLAGYSRLYALIPLRTAKVAGR